MIPRIESLFSGIGGLDLAVERVFGARTWVQVEQQPYQRAVLAQHWPDAEQHPDVCSYRGQGAEIVCGGFPCQNVSALGDRAGLAGVKSGLWREFARIVQESEPDLVIIENVAELRIRGLASVVSDLAALGYASAWTTVKANAAGVYLQRARLFVLACPDSSRRQWRPPTWLFRPRVMDAPDRRYLESFARDSRASTRHRKWNRALDGTWERKNERDSTRARPDVTPALAAEVRARLCEMAKGAEVR